MSFVVTASDEGETARVGAGVCGEAEELARSAAGSSSSTRPPDNIGGGTPGDGTAILVELLAQGAHGALVVLRDPEAVAARWVAGAGARVDIVVGGKTDRLHGDPVRVSGCVRALSPGQFVHRGPYMRGRRADMGRPAA